MADSIDRRTFVKQSTAAGTTTRRPPCSSAPHSSQTEKSKAKE